MTTVPCRSDDFCLIHGYDHMQSRMGDPIQYCAVCEDEKELCTCRMSSVNTASIDPPELILNPWCPVHSGRDPDEENDRRRDDAEFDRQMGWDKDVGGEW